jgi:hypothetical protein
MMVVLQIPSAFGCMYTHDHTCNHTHTFLDLYVHTHTHTLNDLEYFSLYDHMMNLYVHTHDHMYMDKYDHSHL